MEYRTAEMETEVSKNMEAKAAKNVVKTEPRDTLGRPLRDLRISVIDNCNLRCTYCMPLEKYGERYQFLDKGELLSFDEIERVVRLFAMLGVRKVRLTGGEPLLRTNLHELVGRLVQVAGIEDVALTTNGILLNKHAQSLRDSGLHRITVSLDSLDADVFGRMNGRGLAAERVLVGIDAAQAAGFKDIKINTVVQRGVNDHTILELAEYFKARNCIVRFIEYMDAGNRNGWRSEHVVSAAEILERVGAGNPLRPLEENYEGEVASRYAYEDGSTEIGLISSVTKPFCRGCTRARMAADGQVYLCLFTGTGTDVRSALRSGAADDVLLDQLTKLWQNRDDRYSELRQDMSNWEQYRPKVEMYQIGG